MTQTCSVYGLGLHVSAPIAGLAGLRAAPTADVVLTLGSLPHGLANAPDAKLHYVSPDRNERGDPELKVFRLSGNGDYRFDYGDGTVIVVDARGSRVWASWPDAASVEDTATYLLGPILGFVLRLRGVTCLHASAVAMGGRAIALVGPAGAGKSSMAAAFAQLGYPVLTDDVAALLDLGDSFEVQPAYPRVRLWSASVASLFGSLDALPRIVPNWDKRYLDLNGPGYRFQHEPLPLAAIYVLGERSASPTMPRSEPLASRDGLMALVSNTYSSYLIDKDRREKEFELLARLVQGVPLRRVTPSADFARVRALCELIIDDFHELTACPG